MQGRRAAGVRRAAGASLGPALDQAALTPWLGRERCWAQQLLHPSLQGQPPPQPRAGTGYH